MARHNHQVFTPSRNRTASSPNGLICRTLETNSPGHIVRMDEASDQTSFVSSVGPELSEAFAECGSSVADAKDRVLGDPAPRSDGGGELRAPLGLALDSNTATAKSA